MYLCVCSISPTMCYLKVQAKLNLSCHSWLEDFIYYVGYENSFENRNGAVKKNSYRTFWDTQYFANTRNNEYINVTSFHNLNFAHFHTACTLKSSTETIALVGFRSANTTVASVNFTLYIFICQG